MNLRRDNRIVVNLGKCQFARFYYRNQHGHIRDTNMLLTSYYGLVYAPHVLALFHPDYPGETMLERFKRREVRPDVWVPEVLFKLSANHCLIYTGDKAVSLYKAWCALVFKHPKKKGKKDE